MARIPLIVVVMKSHYRSDPTSAPNKSHRRRGPLTRGSIISDEYHQRRSPEESPSPSRHYQPPMLLLPLWQRHHASEADSGESDNGAFLDSYLEDQTTSKLLATTIVDLKRLRSSVDPFRALAIPNTPPKHHGYGWASQRIDHLICSLSCSTFPLGSTGGRPLVTCRQVQPRCRFPLSGARAVVNTEEIVLEQRWKKETLQLSVSLSQVGQVGSGSIGPG